MYVNNSNLSYISMHKLINRDIMPNWYRSIRGFATINKLGHNLNEITTKHITSKT